MDNITGGGTGGQRGERATGTPNTIYNLSSVLFHALKGGASYDVYIEDAEREGDQELAEFFRRVRDEDGMRAEEAQVLLAERTPTTATTTSTAVEPVEGPTAPATGLAAGAPRREETAARIEGRPDTDPAPTDPVIGAGPGEPDASPRIQETTPPRTTGIEEGTLPRREEAATGGVSPRPEPSRDLPGTEPVREAVSRAGTGEMPPAPEEIPPERAGEIPTAEEIPPPRAEEVPSGSPPQAPLGDVQRRTSAEPLPRTQERTGQTDRDQEEDKGLLERFVDAAREALLGQEEPRREEPRGREASREPRRDDPPAGRS